MLRLKPSKVFLNSESLGEYEKVYEYFHKIKKVFLKCTKFTVGKVNMERGNCKY